MKGGRIAFPQEYYGKDTGNYTVENGNNYSSRAQMADCSNFIGPDLRFGQSGGKGTKKRNNKKRNNNNRPVRKVSRKKSAKKQSNGSMKKRVVRRSGKKTNRNNGNNKGNNAVRGMGGSSCGYRRRK